MVFSSIVIFVEKVSQKMDTLEAENAMPESQSRRPLESRFKQQSLPSWRPRVEAASVSPLFFIIGVLLIPIGIGIFYLSETAHEVVLDYTHCNNTDSSDEFYGKSCANKIGKNRNMTCTCSLTFSLDKPMKRPVYIYYKLTNFYQSHRMYVKSRDDFQLLGELSSEVSSDCEPYAYAVERGIKKPIAPCGAIANSLFSDQINLILSTGNTTSVPLLRKGIAWPSDKGVKFRNPPGDLRKAFDGFAKPRDWKRPVWALDPDDPSNNGFENEDLIVWMRTAALPNFRKLFRLVDHSFNPFKRGLPTGQYTLNIIYSYPVAVFGGTKSIIISTTSPLGGDNTFFGMLTIAVGSINLLFALALQIVNLKIGKRLTVVRSLQVADW